MEYISQGNLSQGPTVRDVGGEAQALMSDFSSLAFMKIFNKLSYSPVAFQDDDLFSFCLQWCGC